MAWSKVKNIIIVILLLLNAFLLLLVGGRQVDLSRREAETLTQTIDALALNGIALDESILPGPMGLPALTAERTAAAEEAAAKLLLTGDIITNNSAGLRVYSSVSGNVSFRSGGEISATLSLNWKEGFEGPEYSARLDHATALMSSMGVEVWGMAAGENTVTVVQKVAGAPAFELSAVLTYAGERLTALEGRLLLGQTTQDSEQTASVSLPTALVALLGHVTDSGAACRSINAITPGYLTAATLTDTIRLTPCWLVETDIANYYVDAATGAVSKAS